MFGLGLVYLQDSEMFILTEHDGRASKWTEQLEGKGHLPMQHLWQPFVSGILVVKANLLRRENGHMVVSSVFKRPMTWGVGEVGQSFCFFSTAKALCHCDGERRTKKRLHGATRDLISDAAGERLICLISRPHLGRILSGKRWVWNWAARPGFLSCSNSPMRLWEYSWKVFPAPWNSD